MIQRLRIPIACAAAFGLVLAVGPATSYATSSSRHGHGDQFPTELALPDGFQPEGIAIGSKPSAYFGSLTNGDIFKVDLRTGDGRVISEGPGVGFPSVGIKLDQRGRLFVAGGDAGVVRVIDVRSGEIIESYDVVDPPTAFINDVVLTPRAAWFTDSQNAFLIKVPLGRNGRLPDASDVERLPLTGDWVQVAGFNANGISRTPDGRALIVGQLATGFLFRVNPLTGVATRIDLGGAILENNDGLLLSGRTLFVVQNRSNKVAVVKLNWSGTRGVVVDELTDPRFDVPTTIASFGDRLYLPNARFGIPDPLTATYNAVAIDKP